MKDITIKQQAIRQQLAEQFNIDPERVLFLNDKKPDEAWLNTEALTTIARRSGNFRGISEGFDQFIEPLKQVVHLATVIDKDGHTFTHAGIATISESEEVETHELAAGRALRAALRAAGFNPLRPGAAVTLDLNLSSGVQPSDVAEAQTRNQDLKAIHALAVEKGLIKPLPGNQQDRSAYRSLLQEKFGVATAAHFDATQRASLINFLKQLPDVDEFAGVS